VSMFGLGLAKTKKTLKLDLIFHGKIGAISWLEHRLFGVGYFGCCLLGHLFAEQLHIELLRGGISSVICIVLSSLTNWTGRCHGWLWRPSSCAVLGFVLLFVFCLM
jgi:hypothetical protein